MLQIGTSGRTSGKFQSKFKHFRSRKCMWKFRLPNWRPSCLSLNVSRRVSDRYPVLQQPHDATAWWRHQIETFSTLLAFCARNSTVNGEFPAQRPMTRNFKFSLICAWTISWANNTEAGDLRRHCAHYHVIVMGFNTDSGTIAQVAVKKPRTIWVNHINSLSIIMRIKQNNAQHNSMRINEMNSHKIKVGNVKIVFIF